MDNLRRSTIIVFTITQLLISTNADLFPLPEFTGNDVTSSVFGTDNDEIFPVAFGDLNADKLTDVVTVTRDKSSLVVLYSRQEAPYLQRNVHCNIRTEKNHTVEIVGVAPGDFNGDGLVDLAVTIEQRGTMDKEVIILKGSANDVVCDGGAEKITAIMVQEPLAADLNGDMIVDLIGEEFVTEGEGDKSKTTVKRNIWLFQVDPQPAIPLPFVEETTDGHFVTSGFRKMIRPSSNAFVDTDGDFVPELILITEKLDDDPIHTEAKNIIETYRVNVHSNHDALYPVTFSKKEDDIPIVKTNSEAIQTIGQPLLIDLNQSGELVFLLPFCSKKDCQKDGESGLLAIINGTIVVLPLQGTEYNGKAWKWKYAHRDDVNTRSSFDSFYSRTIALRVGDYNLDGYPDLIGVVETEGENDQNKERRAILLENVPCKSTEKSQCPLPRTFNFKFDVLQNYANVTLATFYDIHDDGLIDVFLVRRSDNNTKPSKGRKYEVRAFENSPDYDSNFFKVMVLSGRDCQRCPQNGIPYGNVVTGPIIKYRTTTQLGDRQTAVAAQNYRSSHLTMDLPYTIFGIGHSPNFVELLIVGISPTPETNRTHEWPQIIPNSQIIVIPPQIGSTDSSWKFKLFLTPSDAVWKTFAVLFGVILVVFAIVCALQYKERKEDKLDRLQEAHRFMM